MITFNQTAAAAVLGGVLSAPANPALAVPPFPAPVVPVAPIKADEKTDAAEAKRLGEDANRKLTAIQEQLKQLAEVLNGKRDEKGFPLPSDPGLVAEMRTLKDKLERLEKDVFKLETDIRSLKSTSLRPPAPGPIPGATVDPKAGKGTVRVVNEYPVQISIVVNGTSHRVAPSKSLDIDVAAGDFTYQLLESGAASTKSVIKERETVTLRIR